MPTRLVVGGLDVPGTSGADPVRDRRDRFADVADDVRRFLVCEPRGHAEMFAAVPLAPAHPDADLGLFFMDASGYLDMCGHATIGAITALVESGRLDPADSIVVETPAGLVRTRPRTDGDQVVAVTFENVPSAFVTSRTVDLPDSAHDLLADQHARTVDIDIVSAGNLCAILDVSAFELHGGLESNAAATLAEFGLEIRDVLNDSGPILDPITDRDRPVTLVEFTETDPTNRTLVVFGDGAVDRSPCGTGTSARMTLHHHRGDLADGERFEHAGPTGETFSGRVLDSSNGVVHTAVTGSAHVTGRHTFTRNATDTLDAFTLE